jgi:hypothetical protein
MGRRLFLRPDPQALLGQLIHQLKQPLLALNQNGPGSLIAAIFAG